jgi:zinc and cadmium transporter
LPLVALAAGTLLGGAFFHLLPEMVEELGSGRKVFLLLALSFLFFFVLEQFLHWHHCHQSPLEHKPVGYMLLLANAVHNLLDGLLLGAIFLIDINLGLIAFLVIAAHEVPQELGDFGALVHSGWEAKKALLWNFISSLPFLLGGLGSFLLADFINPAWLLPLAAGSFLYIGAADLLPELRSVKLKDQLTQFFFLLLGISLLFLLSFLPH